MLYRLSYHGYSLLIIAFKKKLRTCKSKIALCQHPMREIPISYVALLKISTIQGKKSLWGNWATASELKNQTETLLVHMDPILLKKFQPQFTLRWILSILIGCFKSCDHQQRQATAHHSTTTGQKLKFKSFKAVEKKNWCQCSELAFKDRAGMSIHAFPGDFFSDL